MNPPTEIPLMPLSGSVLFPGSVLPLYLFEPRYSKMMRDVLEGPRCFAVGMIRPGVDEAGEADPTYRVVGAGLMRAAITNEDQTGHVLLLGLYRARIRAIVGTHPYRVAELEPLKDRLVPGRRGQLDDRASGVVAAALDARKTVGRDTSRELIDLLLSIRDPSRLADTAAFYLLGKPANRQRILETLNIERRIEKLHRLLLEELLHSDEGPANGEESGSPGA